MNIISERIKKDTRKFELIEQDESLGFLNTCLRNLMTYLWEKPEIVYIIIKNANKNDLKEIAPLFTNNFYENILSSYYIEDNLMYLLTLLLKDEINNLYNINQEDYFLNNTPCGIILGELKSKKDIQEFFKTIILSSIEDLEVNYSSLELNFNINYLSNKFKKQSDSNTYINNCNNYSKDEKFQKKQEYFNSKYIPILNKDALEKKTEEYKNKKNMYDYCNSKINYCNSDENYYSNKILMDNIFHSNFSHEILTIYQNNFIVAISFINSIIENILNNFHLLPYSLKCLCKIIELLINIKFPKIHEFEKNAFIAKFFFGKLLIPILQNPTIEAFINDFIISRNTNYNLKILTTIIEKLTSGQFFISDLETCDYTPFNWYFLEKMEKLFEIFRNLTKIKLPNFIEKLINNELPSDYEYNFFKENPDEVINHRSICFNLSQSLSILNVIEKCKDQILKDNKNIRFQKTIEKLIDPCNKSLIKNYVEKESIYNKQKLPLQQKSSQKIEKEEKVKESNINVLHYFLFTELLTNQQYKKLMNIEQKTSYFSIKELKTTPNEESEIKNNIIKVKNFFCSLLYNYNKLVKTDFDEGTTENTIKILKELNNFMKSSSFVEEGSIPFNWYVNSLLEYLQKIPKNLTNNDCEELYKEIENDLNQSIKELDFEALSVIIGKLKYAKRGKKYYEESSNLLNDIKLNEETKKIIENELIPFEIKFNLDDENIDESIFEINESNIKEKDRSSTEKIKKYEKSKDVRLCLTIDSFTKKFPDLMEYQDKLNLDVFKFQKDLKFPEKIKSYFNQVSQILEKKGKIEMDKINQKIYDYVMGKLYDKIYPYENYEEDDKIFQQSIRLSWTEPKHFITSKKKFVFGNFLSDVLAYYKLVDTEKSPRKKLLNVIEIFKSIGFLLKFNNSGKDIGVDDQMPILNYVFIKARPLRMFSNAKIMELYIGNKKNKGEGNLLSQILSVCEFIINLQYSDLADVTPEEFTFKSKEATSKEIIL